MNCGAVKLSRPLRSIVGLAEPQTNGGEPTRVVNLLQLKRLTWYYTLIGCSTALSSCYARSDTLADRLESVFADGAANMEIKLEATTNREC